MQAPPAPDPRPIDHLAGAGAPGDLALVVGEVRLDFAALEDRVARIAAALRAAGAAAGDRVASWLPKTVEACLLPLAAPRAATIHVPINPALRRAQVAHILADSGAALLLTSEARAATLEPDDVPAGCRVLTDLPAGEARLPPSGEPTDALAAILYTSGSTGRPKGVMLSHANLWLGAVSVASFLHLGADDRTLCVLPLAFDYGQNQLFSAWIAGGAAIAHDYLHPGGVIAAADRHGVTTLAGVPPVWLRLAEANWPPSVAQRLRRITNSGGRLPLPLVRRLRALFPEAALHAMYGLTEAFRAASLDPMLIDAHPDAVGTAIPYAELFVLDLNGQPVPPGTTGELVQAGPLVAQGYWRDPTASAGRFRPAPVQSRWGGTAVWSGDTVMIGADGLLRVLGRDDEQIKVAGHRVSPSEIEEAAVAIGEASEAFALGVPDEALGEAVRLVVRGRGDPARLAAHLARALPSHMQPREIRWVDRMPLGPNDKLDRAALRQEHRS